MARMASFLDLCTGYSLSDILIYLSINPKYNIALYCKFEFILPITLHGIVLDFIVNSEQFDVKYSQVPIKRVGPNKRVGWIFIKYFYLSLCLFLSSCFFGAK